MVRTAPDRVAAALGATTSRSHRVGTLLDRVPGEVPDRVLHYVLDTAFTVAVRRAREPTGLWITERQLYYELCRVLRPAQLVPRWLPFTVPPAVSMETSRDCLRRHGPVSGLLQAPVRSSRPPGRCWLATESDVLDYGLPRLLVVQDAATAAMLRANHWHQEAACPVYGLDELADLEGREALASAVHAVAGVVYVLHDASAAGTFVPERVHRLVGGEPSRFRPLGLRPEHTRTLHLATTGDHSTVELAAVPPSRLLRVLHRLVRGVTPPHRPGWRELVGRGYLSWPPS